eukprot:364329-Chlamydomonas_euryale.AAC.3
MPGRMPGGMPACPPVGMPGCPPCCPPCCPPDGCRPGGMPGRMPGGQPRCMPAGMPGCIPGSMPASDLISTSDPASGSVGEPGAPACVGGLAPGRKPFASCSPPMPAVDPPADCWRHSAEARDGGGPGNDGLRCKSCCAAAAGDACGECVTGACCSCCVTQGGTGCRSVGACSVEGGCMGPCFRPSWCCGDVDRWTWGDGEWCGGVGYEGDG